MHMRVTHYKMKPDAMEAATAKLHDIKAQIMALPGMHQFTNSANADGTGCIVSLVESREISEANQSAVQAV